MSVLLHGLISLVEFLRKWKSFTFLFQMLDIPFACTVPVLLTSFSSTNFLRKLGCNCKRAFALELKKSLDFGHKWGFFHVHVMQVIQFSTHVPCRCWAVVV